MVSRLLLSKKIFMFVYGASKWPTAVMSVGEFSIFVYVKNSKTIKTVDFIVKNTMTIDDKSLDNHSGSCKCVI